MRIRAKRSGLTKTEACRVHAKRQAYRRYGIFLNGEDLRSLVNEIHNGRALFITRKTASRSCWKITWCGYDLVAIYDRSRKVIVTFLPPDCREVQERAFLPPSQSH